MNFSNILNKYINELNCTALELSNKSGVSNAVISRYRKGDKIPKYNSEQLNNIIDALYTISKEKKINITKKQIKNDLERVLNKNEIDFDTFKNNFNYLINTLNINVADISRYIGYDASYLSKIRSGIRKPLNINEFADKVCKYIIKNYDKYNNRLKELNCNNYDELYFWLTNNKHIDEYNIDSFLTKLDSFDLNDYIKTIKFDKLFVPTLPKGISKSKNYYGIDGYKEAQIDTLRQIAFSKSKEDVFWMSTMPFDELSKDSKFSKKYMMYLAFILKKGLKLNIIHDLDRPFKELMLGLEGWIPLYMTGQINPYYFKENKNPLAQKIECNGGSVALSGDCITNNIETSKMFVTNKNDEVKLFKDRNKLIIKKASPLMEIYNESKKDSFIKNISNNGNRKNILSSLPIYTISDELLNKILDNNNVSNKLKKEIIKNVNNEKKRINNILKDYKVVDNITSINEKDFNNYYLNLSSFFIDTNIKYIYEDYKEHLKLTKQFKNKNYKCTISNNIFKNINICIIDDKEVIISKVNQPSIHFVIHHPTLVDAIINFKGPSIKDEL